MPLALFDLDNTLLGGDSDYLWGQYLVQHRLVDPTTFERENQRYYADYNAGRLDIDAFLAFQLQPLAQHTLQQLSAWRADFIDTCIQPIILPAARRLIEQHRAQSHDLLIVTATNRFITQPIAELFGISELVATDPEFLQGRFTGRVTGIPCFRDGKVKLINLWLAEHQKNLRGSWFYSDSHNDLPLLQQVEHPVAVNPDPILEAHAKQHGWEIVDLRGP